MVIATPTRTCANDAVDMISIPRVNSSDRIERMIRIVFPSAPSSFACPVWLCCSGLRGTVPFLDANKWTSCYMTRMLEFRQGASHPVMGVEGEENCLMEQGGGCAYSACIS